MPLDPSARITASLEPNRIDHDFQDFSTHARHPPGEFEDVLGSPESGAIDPLAEPMGNGSTCCKDIGWALTLARTSGRRAGRTRHRYDGALCSTRAKQLLELFGGRVIRP